MATPEPNLRVGPVGVEAGADTEIEEELPDLDDVDGRTLRRRRNRERVIQSLIALIREGDLSPTVAKIADRAGVSHRSIFRYFDDLNDLARTAIETELVDVLPTALLPDIGLGTFEERLDRLITIRMPVLKNVHGLMRVAWTRSVEIPEIDRGLSMISGIMRDQLRRHFAPELEAIESDGGDPEAALAGVALLVGAESYDHQRRRMELTDAEIEANWRSNIPAILRVA